MKQRQFGLARAAQLQFALGVAVVKAVAILYF